MTCDPIRVWNVCISGFLQNESRLTGVLAIWRRLHADFYGSDVRVELRTWRENWSALADCIHLLRPDDQQPVVNVFGYSWGGYAAVLLARQLERRGIVVANLVLCDAVYRHSYWLGNWRALVPWSRIVVPANVQRVRWFRQRVGMPMGHEVVPADERRTHVYPAKSVGVEHVYMDELPEFAATCRAVVWESCHRPGEES